MIENASNIVMVRFGELSTKGKNIKDFIKKLAANIKTALYDFKNIKYDVKHDHIYLYLNGENFDIVKEKLQKVPGIMSFSLCEAIDKDIESIKEKALKLVESYHDKTFKIITKRVDKLFPMTSDEINREVAAMILKTRNDLKVDVHNPDLPLHIQIRENICYMYLTSYKGLGGYPNGIAGKGLMLLSGGIDSPVASYLLMKRGIKLEMIHFAAPPYTSSQVIVKLNDILSQLTIYQPEIKLYIVPFTEIQKKIYEISPRSYAITIMRRKMLDIASRVAFKHNDLVLATGESVGQVASQTLKSIRAIEKDCTLPIIRPLATYDKVDIIDISNQIGTYDISIRPYEDCCTIFTVKDPTTCPHFDVVNDIESKFDFESMIKQAIDEIEVKTFSYIEKDKIVL